MNGRPALAIFARRQLVATEPRGPALLLEGDWPQHEQGAERWSLDAAIDGRHAWIDREASRLAENAARGGGAWRGEGPPSAAALADLLALKLRYYFVRLLRLAAFFHERAGDFRSARFVFESPRDDDYRLVLEQLLPGSVDAQRSVAVPQPISPPAVSAWRRGLSRLAAQIAPRRARRCVLLCGNPARLEAVADAFRAAGEQPWWLYDDFAVKAWLRRRILGEGQLWRAHQAAPLATSDVADLCRQLPSLASRGVELRDVVAKWLAREAAARGDWLSSVPNAVERHVSELRPRAVVLDQDATPLARALVRAARRRGIPSLVVQHGAPCVRFGFTPLSADRFCAWGEASRDTLIGWGVEADRIAVTGCVGLQPSVFRLQPSVTKREGRAPRLLLLATVPPRDERPDAVEFHLTTRSYAEMLMAVAEVRERLGGELIVRLHPRGHECAALRELRRRGARLAPPGASLIEQVREADCVLSCASSAGSEAAQWGAPVLNLLPAGSADLFPADAWGLAGTARTAAELLALVERCLTDRAQPSRIASKAFYRDAHTTAAQRVVALAEELIRERPASSSAACPGAPSSLSAEDPACEVLS